MKKLLTLFVFITSIAQAQYTVKGTMTPPEGDVVMLYKIEGAEQKFVTHTNLKVDTVSIGGEQQILGRFDFTLPKEAKTGAYRATYRSGGGFVDFLFNREDIELVFNPQYPDQSVTFLNSLENKLYREYLDALALTQQNTDSIQISYLETKAKSSKKAYKNALKELEKTQEIYEKKSQGMLANHFIKASKTTNNSSPLNNVQDYLNSVVGNYFNNIDFSNPVLRNSPFLIDKVNYYVMYLNSSDSQSLQQKLYKESIAKVMTKVADNKQKKQFSEYLITVFTDKRNSEIVDWMFDDYYSKLPVTLQDVNFKNNKLEALRVSVGRKAPDFSWKEDGKNYKLSTLNDGEKYLLIFWSTQCSHCTEEIPKVHEIMKKHKNTSVIAFAIENDDIDFNSWAKNKLYNFHNVIGTHPDGRFENQTVKDYLIDATPTYFVLDKNKKIIAVPDVMKDVKEYFEKEAKK